MKKLDLPVTDVKALSRAAEDYAKTYLERFPATLQGPFNISVLSEGVSSTIQQTITSVTGGAANLLKDQIFVNQGGVLFTAGNLGQAVSGTVSSVLNDLSQAKGVFNTAGNILGGVQSGLGNLQNLAGQGLTTQGLQGLQGLANNAIGGIANRALAPVTSALGKINNVAGQVNVVNDIYKSVMGTSITSVTQVRSVVGMIGNQIGSTIATVGRSIGKIFGF
jgi:hypothetical protein